jgi:hypothetical protein
MMEFVSWDDEIPNIWKRNIPTKYLVGGAISILKNMSSSVRKDYPIYYGK